MTISRTMFRALTVGVLLAATAPGTATSAAPADSPSHAISAVDGVAYQDCFELPFDYALTPASGDWYATFIARDSSGGTVGSATISSVLSAPPSGTGSLSVCSPRPGDYTVSGDLTWTLASGVGQTETIAASTATLRAPHTRIRARVVPRRPRLGQTVRAYYFPAEEHSTGWIDTSGGRLKVAMRQVGQGWQTSRGSVAAEFFGDAYPFTNTRARAYDFRWVYLPAGVYAPSTSAPVRVRPRRTDAVERAQDWRRDDLVSRHHGSGARAADRS